MKREIEIKIDPDGNVSVQVRGVKGKECLEFSKFLEESLGEVGEREYTSEYYQKEPEVRNVVRGA